MPKKIEIEIPDAEIELEETVHELKTVVIALTTELEAVKEKLNPVLSFNEQEAAERLGLKDVNSLRRLRYEGKISFSMVLSRARYTPDDLREFIQRNRHRAKR